MTVITKPLSEKVDKNQEPLVDHLKVSITSGVGSRCGSGVGGRRAGGPTRGSGSATTACLLLTALLVMSCGVITGLCLYRQFARAQIQRLQTWCNIPVSSEGKRLSMYPDLPHYFSPLLNKLNQNDGQESENFLKEEFEIDDNYEKITVPDFSGARHSRFLHNFKTNYTIIVDVDGKRCFVMPLNRTLVLPPKNLYDLVSKMREGYYDIDTSILRETMRVVLPMIEDRSKLGDFIQRDCGSYPIYRLEKIVSGVYKRSADEPEEYKFMVFSGKNTQDIRIVNPSAFEKDESQRPIAMA